MRLFLNINIKTIPAQDPAVRDAIANAPDLQDPTEIGEIKPSAALKDPEKIAADIAARTLKAVAALAEAKAAAAAKAEQRYLKTALDGACGHVISIAWSVDRILADGSMAAGRVAGGIASNIGDERALLDLVLRQMEKALADGERPVLVGHNLVGFDLPFLMQRAIVLGVKLPTWWPRSLRPWSGDVFDTMLQWSSREWISLDALCSRLGLGGKADMVGSMVYQLWQRGDLDRIWDYNCCDVRKVSQIRRKYDLVFGDLTNEDWEFIENSVAEIARLLREGVA